MKRLSLSLLALAGLAVGSVANAQIQQVSHTECGAPECAAPAVTFNGCGDTCGEGCGLNACGATCNDNCIGYSGHWGGCNTGACNGMFNGNCLSGNCQLGGCRSGHGFGCLGSSCIARCCGTKAFPDAGWAPPARMPVNRDRTWYGSYYPQAFYGSPGGGFVGGYPQVYQPTDTTQLGYSYGIVPTWQTRPGMIPATPIPSHYHARVCPSGGCQSGVCPTGACHHYASGHNVHAVSWQPQHVVHQPQVAFQPQVSRPQIVRPQVADNGARKWFRLSSLTELFD
ncbi:MAG: hypothetical protein R3C20_17080 [Planctomycetaceae bacterium]